MHLRVYCILLKCNLNALFNCQDIDNFTHYVAIISSKYDQKFIYFYFIIQSGSCGKGSHTGNQPWLECGAFMSMLFKIIMYILSK